MAKKNLTKQVLTAAFAVAGLTLSGNDVQAMGMPASNTDLTKTNIMLSPQESQELNIKSDIKFFGANRFSKSSKIFSSRGAGVNTNVLSRSGRSLSMTGTPTGAAAPTPTLDKMKSKASAVLPTLGKYTLTELTGTAKAPAGTQEIGFNGKRYYFTPAETTAEKANMLSYLAGSMAVAYKTGTDSNYLFTDGTNYYTIDTEKLPTSVYTLTEGTSADYDIKSGDDYYKFNFKTNESDIATYTAGTSSKYDFQALKATKDGTIKDKYYNITIYPTKLSHIGNKVAWSAQLDAEPSGYTWKNNYVAGSNVTVDTTAGTVSGAIRMKMPHNGETPTDWNRYFTYTYTKPTGYDITQKRINDTIDADGTNVQNKVFAGITDSSNGGAIYNSQNRSTVDIIADFVGNSSSSSSYSYGGAIYNNYGTISSITGNFIGNSVSGSRSYGGAIFNNSGTISSITGDFIGNSSYNGGAICNNSGTISSITGDFIGNSASYYGGAIANFDTISSITGNFIGNSASSAGESYGGAIYNSGTISSITGDFIGNSDSSSSHSYSSYGGAIYNNSGTISSITGDFIGNSASGLRSYGGAIYNNSGTISSITGDFIGNSSYYGGAIYNNSGTISSITGNFIGNSASGLRYYGGAIYNEGTINSISGDFTGNYAKNTSTTYKAWGGAIYNGSVSSLDNPSYNANSQITLGDTTFTGNYVDNNGTITPNSIYNAGVINIANGATVTINDGYDGLGEAQLNIGTSSDSGSIFNLSVDNNYIQTDNLGTVTNYGSINWDLDVDLTSTDADNMSDKITFSSLNGGSIIIRAINLLHDKAGSTAITITSSSLSNKYSLSSAINEHITSPGNFAYTATYSGGVLTLNQVILDSLALKVHDDDPVRSYEMTKIENVGENLGDLVGEGAKLSVNGGGYSIVGGEWEGINVASGQTLEFNNVSDVTGFANDTAVTNGGTLNIKDSKFTSDIINTNELNLNSTNTTTSINTFDGEIGMGTASTGTINVETGKTLFNDTVTQADMTVASGAQVEIGAGNLVITNAVQNDGTVTLTGGTVESFAQLNSSIANKTEELTTPKTVIDGFVNVGNGKTISQAIEINENKALSANVNSVGGSVTNNGNLAIYDYENSESNHFAQSVTGNGTTTIQRNVIVDSTIANNIIIDKFEGTSPAVTHYADVVVGSTGLLGAEGTTITVNANNQLTMATGAIAADSITNNGTLILNNSTDGEIGKAISGTSGVLSINTTGTNAANVTVTANSTLTNQAVSVNNGIFKLGSGSLAENSAVTVNDGAGFDSRDGDINNYLDGKVTLKDGSRVFVDVSADGDNPVIDQFASNAAATVTLSNINILGANDLPTGTVRLLSAGTVTGESLFVQDDGKTIAVQGSGENNGMIKIGMTHLSDKLNGAVYVSGAVDAITYKLTTDNEDVNPVGAYDALGTIQDSFIIKSSTPGTKKSLTAREGTFGLIVQAEKDLEVDDVVFKNFSTNDTYKGVITNYGTLTVKDSQFDMVEDNAKKVAIENYGILESDPTLYHGAIVNHYDAYALIEGDTFDGSSRAGENGGAIFNEAAVDPDPAGVIEVNEDASHVPTTFINNVAANGGGIYNAGTATISNAVFGAVDTSGESPVYSGGNSAVTTSGGDGFGGAIYNSGSLTVTDTKFYANSAVKGGAIYSTADTTINATDAVVEFAGNTASTAGNDIYMEGTSGSPITLYLNSASDTNSITLNGGIDGSNYNVSVNNSTAGTVNIASLANAATLALNGGTTNITSDTTVTELTAADHTTLNASSANGLSTGTLTVDDSGTFINSGKLSVTSTLNNGSTGATGTITNTNAVLNLLGGTSATAPMTNIGSISGGNINIGSYTSDTVKDTAYVVNSGSITGEVSVAKKSTLQTAANTVNDSTGIANAGKLTLTGGNLASAVSGTGVTNVIGTVTNTDAKEIANAVEITYTGHLTTSTDALTSTTTTKNAGTLVFNNTTSEALNQSISDNDGIHGTVDIATATGDIIIDMTGKTITNNTIKLTRGTLKTGSDNGNVDLSSADKIEANGGTLSVQDGKTGTITLGNVDTSAGTLKFDIDVNLGGSGTPATADTLTLADGKAIGNDHGITISNIHIVDPDHGYQTEDYIMLADDTIGDILDVTKSELTVADGDVDAVKDLLINKVYEDGTGTRDQGTYLHTAHSDLDNAILSSIDDKMYFVGDPVIDNSAGALNLGGNSLSITGNNATITSSIDSSADPDLRQDGINIVDAGQTLTIQNAQIGDDGTGFDTAIDNSNGGTINLDGVTMTANNIDVLNDGEIDVTDPDNPVDHGVFLTGTNSINSIVDSDGSATHGQTTVKGGTSTINTIKQKSVTVDADATANLTNVDNVKTTDGITNDGDLVLAGGTADTPANNDNKITMTADAGNAKTTIASGSNIANNAEMTQKEVVVSATDGTNPAAILTNNDDIYANTVNIEDGATLNNNKNITASDVNVKSNADLNLNAGSNTLGDVTLDAADSELSITDDAVLAGDVKSDNNGQINLIADTQDIVMSDAITGNLTSVDGTDVGAYIINATTADPTGTDTSVTIDKAIAGATTINVSADTNAIITNVATDSNSSALVFANSNSEITLRNDSTTDDMNVGMSVFDASADGYELNTENTSPDTTISLKGNIVGADDVNTNVTGGTTNIDGSVNAKNLNAKDGTTNINGSANVADVNTEVGATTNINKNSNLTAENVNTNGGTTNINEKITAVNVNANGGDTNLNANGDSKTSDKLASAKVNIQNGANVNVNTDSDSMTIDNKVKGSGSTSNLILNGKQGKAGSGSNAGTQFNLGTAVDNANVVVSNGQLNLPDESKLANGSIVDVGSGATLNTISGKASDYNKDITFEDASQVKTDINANTGKADRFVNVIQGENDGVVLTDAELQDLDKVLRHTTKIDLAKATNLHNLTIGEELLNKTFTEMTAIRKMSAKFSEDGMLTIMPSSGRNNYDDFNPAVVVGPIAAQLGGYLSQLNSYDEAFRNLDMKMLMTREERKALKMANSYASEVQPQVFSSTYLPEKDSAGWFRPYASFEKVNLKYGPNAENTMYGSYFGGDSSMKELRNGWDYQYSVYVGYNGSHQNYQGNSIYQNGGNLGATAIWYKDDFFTALTANVGASVADASTYYGSENFPMLMTGIASKTGYNWELAKGKFIVQPSYLMSYTFVHTFDYMNAAGVKISSNPLNAINIAPGLKFIGNLKHGWQPYVGVQMVWNIMDKADYKANDIPLPQMSVKPYFQYGVGVQKRWGERFTGFVQAMMRNGGRNGIALSGGLRWAIGKDYHSYPDYTPKSKAKTTIKTNKDAKVTTSTDVIKKSKQDVTSKNITNETTNKVTKPTKKSKLSQFFAFMNGEPTYVVSVKTK